MMWGRRVILESMMELLVQLHEMGISDLGLPRPHPQGKLLLVPIVAVISTRRVPRISNKEAVEEAGNICIQTRMGRI